MYPRVWGFCFGGPGGGGGFVKEGLASSNLLSHSNDHQCWYLLTLHIKRDRCALNCYFPTKINKKEYSKTLYWIFYIYLFFIKWTIEVVIQYKRRLNKRFNIFCTSVLTLRVLSHWLKFISLYELFMIIIFSVEKTVYLIELNSWSVYAHDFFFLKKENMIHILADWLRISSHLCCPKVWEFPYVSNYGHFTHSK